jgi:spore maturation protein CgeB
VRWLVAHPGAGFSVADVFEGYVEALIAAGEKVVKHPLHDMFAFYDNVYVKVGSDVFRKALSGQQASDFATDRLAGALYKVRPDVLLVVSGFFADPLLLDVARRDGVKVVTIHTEEPYEHARELELASHSDLALLTEPVNVEDFRTVTRAEHFGHAYRPAIHHPGPPDLVLACDFTFVGTGYPSRVAFFEAMNLDGVDATLAGNWERLDVDSPLRRHVIAADCLDNADTAELYRSAKAGLNLYRREGESASGWAIGPREIEMAACGLFFLRDPRPETDELLPMLPAFTSSEEAGELLRWWLCHDSDREAAAVKAHDAIADRTFDQHAARLLRLLDA